MTDDLKEKLGDVSIRFYDNEQLSRGGKTLGRDFIDTAQDKAQKKGASWFFEIDENTGKARNPHVPRHFASTGAGNIGYTPLSGAETIKEMDGFQVESRHWEAGIKTASIKGPERAEKLNNLIKEMGEAEKESANEEIKKIIASAISAAERKLQETPGTIKTEQGKITVSKKAAGEARKQRERRSPGGEREPGTGKGPESGRPPGGERE